MDWTAYGAIVATLALLLSGVSLWLYWRREVQSDADRQPEVRIERSWFDPPPGWISLRLVVRNLDRFTMTVDSARLLSPKTLRLALLSDAMEDQYGLNPMTVQPRSSGDTIRFGTRLEASGNRARPSAGSYTIGDIHGEDFLVSVPSSNVSLKLLISMSSSATAFKIRNRRISIKLTPPMEPPTTKATSEN